MPGINHGTKYTTSHSVRNRKEGITLLNGKYVVRIFDLFRKSKSSLNTVGQYNTIEEAEEVYKKSNELMLDKFKNSKTK